MTEGSAGKKPSVIDWTKIPILGVDVNLEALAKWALPILRSVAASIVTVIVLVGAVGWGVYHWDIQDALVRAVGAITPQQLDERVGKLVTAQQLDERVGKLVTPQQLEERAGKLVTPQQLEERLAKLDFQRQSFPEPTPNNLHPPGYTSKNAPADKDGAGGAKIATVEEYPICTLSHMQANESEDQCAVQLDGHQWRIIVHKSAVCRVTCFKPVRQ